MGKPQPKWLQDKISETRRAANRIECGKCGADVLRGESDDHQYWIATVDPTPVAVHDEIAARLDGRMSYDAMPCRGEIHLYARQPEHVRRKPAKFVVLIDHRCDTRRPAPANEPTPETTQGALF